MNRRLQQRLTEPEILKIFSDVAEVCILCNKMLIMVFLTNISGACLYALL